MKQRIGKFIDICECNHIFLFSFNFQIVIKYKKNIFVTKTKILFPYFNFIFSSFPNNRDSYISIIMSSMEKIKQRLMHFCIAITFFTSGLIINAIQLVLHLTLKPFNKWLFRRIMYYLCYSLYSRKLEQTIYEWACICL